MHPETQKAYEKCLELRKRENLALKPSVVPHLRQTYTDDYGEEQDFRLRYYQVQAVLHLHLMNVFILGDDCGLGKTPTALAALCAKWGKDPNIKAIVLTPKSALRQWVTETKKFTTGVKAFPVTQGPKKRKKVYEAFQKAEGPCMLIMNYEKARIDFSILQDWSGYVLVTDEATKYKTPGSHTHQVVSHMAFQARARWALTATMIKGNLIEGYAIIECLFPGTFGVKAQFIKNYCRSKLQRRAGGKGKVRVITGHTKAHIAKFKERIDPFYIGRAKHEVASELPVLTRRRVIVGINNHQRTKYNQALSGIIAIDNPEKMDGEQFVETTPLTALIRCQQIVNHPDLIGCEGESEKMDALLDLLVTDFDGDKVIIFTKFKEMVDILMPQLEKLGLHPVRVTGSETDRARVEAMRKFQDMNSETRVICITTAGSDAINLQSAKAIVYYDLPWTAGDYLQATGRMIRIGSRYDRCYAIHLIADDTIDTHVEEVLKRKMRLVEAVLGKRIKGDDDKRTIIKQQNEISDIYKLLINDARSV